MLTLALAAGLACGAPTEQQTSGGGAAAPAAQSQSATAAPAQSAGAAAPAEPTATTALAQPAGMSDTAAGGAVPYPASSAMGLMHTALGNGLADFLTGAKDAATTLADIESAYLTAAKEAGLI